MIDPQESFLTNCKFLPQESKTDTERCVLAWNLIGTVILRREGNQYTSIDLEFNDRGFHRNFNFTDDIGACMASLSYSGIMLASKSKNLEE